MLYDILSPLIFFFSLGGILLIVGRVVIRIRRQQFSTDLKSAAASTLAPASFGIGGDTEASSFLQPTKKSVQLVKSRLGALRGSLVQSRATIAERWRNRKENSSILKSVAKESSKEEAPTLTNTATIVMPSGTGLRQRLLGSASKFNEASRMKLASMKARLKKEPAEIVNDSELSTPDVPVASQESDKKKSGFSLRLTKRTATGDDEKKEVAPATAAPAANAPAVVVPAQLKPRAGRFGGTLLRRAHPGLGTSPMDRADAALAEKQFQQVEDIIVPYIVKHPKDTAAYMLLGRAALGRKSWTDAMEIFEQVISWNEKHEGAYAALGTAAYRAGKFTRALQALQRAHDANPQDKAVLKKLLSIAQKMDNQGLLHSISEELKALDQKPTVQPSERVVV